MGCWLIDAPDHPRDAAAAIERILAGEFGASSARIQVEAFEILGAPGLRAWLADGWFARHVRTHSQPRRKAPAVWPLSSPRQDPVAWVHGPNLTPVGLQTLAEALNGPALPAESSASREAVARRIERLLAARWTPDPADGIPVNLAAFRGLLPAGLGDPEWERIRRCELPWCRGAQAISVAARPIERRFAKRRSCAPLSAERRS